MTAHQDLTMLSVTTIVERVPLEDFERCVMEFQDLSGGGLKVPRWYPQSGGPSNQMSNQFLYRKLQEMTDSDRKNRLIALYVEQNDNEFPHHYVLWWWNDDGRWQLYVILVPQWANKGVSHAWPALEMALQEWFTKNIEKPCFVIGVRGDAEKSSPMSLFAWYFE